MTKYETLVAEILLMSAADVITTSSDRDVELPEMPLRDVRVGRDEV